MRILALDPSTHCGFAYSCGISGEWDLSVRRDESSGMRLIRLRGKLNEIHSDGGIDLLVFEAARNSMPGMQGSLVRQAELQAIIILWCEDNKINYRGYSPSEIKKHATNKGNSGKEKMIASAETKFNKQNLSDNEADALWLLDLARRDYK